MSIYEVNKINHNLYAIKEDITNNKFPIFIYFVIGTEKGALIDTGLGTGNLKKVVQSITNLPIIVLHTHAHGDHIGADPLFSEIYLNNLEHDMIKKEEDRKALDAQREGFIEQFLKNQPDRYEYVKEHMIKGEKVEYKNIKDGDVIDLGGIQLEAVHTPGHTTGSISYINKRDHYGFTGDGIADIHWFDTEEAGAVEDFLHMLHHFEEKAKGMEEIYATHVPQSFPFQLVRDLQGAAQAIVDGADDPIENANYQFLIHGDLYTHRQGIATIYYKEENIYSKK